MGDVLVRRAKVSGGRVEQLEVELYGLAPRVVDRTTALGWLRDGHSLVPVVAGARGTALQLVDVGDELFIRADNEPVAEDRLPELPSV